MSLATSLSQDQLVNESLSWDIDLDHLRQLTFRENFARLCFGKLLSHAFSTPLITRSSSATSTSLPLENGHVENTNNYKINPLSTSFSLMVSKAAVRSILQRCRSILIKFYQASRLTGKCPLPRARSAEISYVFKALTVMLTSLQSLPIQHDVDDSIWSTVIELYPHIVDCVLVAGGSNQMAVALHHLLRLYGEFLAPAQLGPGGGNSKSKKESSSSISYSNNINSMDIANDIANGNMNQNKGSVNGT
uniref:MON2 like protein n=1 Tax=Schistosoma japonicum TaxID=6182 RepID=C1L3N3_SCHJA|nr:MON2 like protein [Schistosoma japonicum]